VVVAAVQELDKMPQVQTAAQV